MPHRLKQRLSHLVLQRDARFYRSLRDAMWLYLALVVTADDEGVVEKGFEELSLLTGLKEGTLRSWAGHLKKLGLIETKPFHGSAPTSFVVHGLERKGHPGEHSELETKPREAPARHVLQGDTGGESTSSQNQDLGALAEYVRHGLGDEETDLEHYAELLEGVPKEVIRQAFEQARRVPREKIRKSRGALFTYLIKQYGKAKKGA